MNKRTRKKKGLAKITNEECWGLDITLAKYILPRLEKFEILNTNIHPCEFKNMEEWHKIINKMIYSFKFILKDELIIDIELSKAEDKRVQEGLDLFARYFRDLWD